MREKMLNILRWWRRKPLRLEVGSNGGAAHTPAADVEPFMDHYHRLGIPRRLHYPSTTMDQLLDQSAQRFADAPALIYGELRWSYSQLHQQVNRLAGGLAVLGVRRGDRVLMTMPNCPEFVTAFGAIQKLGAVVVNAGPLMGADDLARLIEMTEPRLIIALDLQAPLLSRVNNNGQQSLTCLWVSLRDYQTVWKRMAYRLKLWQLHNHAFDPDDQLTLAKLLAKSPARPPTVAPDPDDLAVLQPTGGTTGTLKVAQLSHRNLIANAAQMSVWVRLRPAQERVLAILPMFHVYGLSTCLTTAIYNAAVIMPLTRFHVGQVIDTIAEHRPTVLPLVPTIMEAMCDELEQHPNPAVCDVIQNATVISGAAPLTPATAQRFERLTGGRIIQGYGLTEASPVTHTNPIDDPRDGSIGLPLPDTDVRVVDLADPTRDARPGEPGELWITGPQVMHGYLSNPDENERMFSIDEHNRRWLRTGDVVRVDDDGFFSVVGRRKEMINRGGLKVWPAKIERVLVMHPQVTDAAVIGRADTIHTEVVVAVVASDAPATDTHQLETELRALCREHLARYEVPGRFEFVKQLPRSPLGKMLKYRLRGTDEPRTKAPQPLGHAAEVQSESRTPNSELLSPGSAVSAASSDKEVL